jgi:hypothetical protein
MLPFARRTILRNFNVRNLHTFYQKTPLRNTIRCLSSEVKDKPKNEHLIKQPISKDLRLESIEIENDRTQEEIDSLDSPVTKRIPYVKFL